MLGLRLGLESPAAVLTAGDEKMGSHPASGCGAARGVVRKVHSSLKPAYVYVCAAREGWDWGEG